MRLTAKAWSDYADRLSRLNTKAGQLMRAYLERYGAEDTSALISYASALVDKYGEGSAELACQMYDAMAEAAGLTLPAAEPAAPAAYGELAKAVNGTKHSPALLQSAVSRLVKQAGADTTLKNAIRDGAEFAWIPHGDTCAFCLMLASRGWQKAGKRTLKNGHAEHIHANCDCEYAVRFNASPPWRAMTRRSIWRPMRAQRGVHIRRSSTPSAGPITPRTGRRSPPRSGRRMQRGNSRQSRMKMLK